MRIVSRCCFLLFVLFLQSASAGEIREIEFIDGSTITGEVLSLSGGIYIVRTDSLGTIKLEESKIRAIRAKSSGKNAETTQSNAGSSGEIKTLQEKMMSNEEVMTLIRSLQNDPEFQKALQDPEIMKAVSAGDVAALTANPAFMKLLNNATVKEIQKKTK